MTDPDSTTPDPTPASPRHDRAAAAQLLDDCLDHQRRLGTSARHFAAEHGLPRSTLGHWLRRRPGGEPEPDPAVAAFFESPAGLALLHRLLTAGHLVFCLQGAAGVRLLSDFLRLAGLDRFAAASFGSRQQSQARLEQQVIDFAADQRGRLAHGMQAQEIALAEDETYHPQICLVAMEPVSGFLLVEQYAARRDAATWDAAVHQALAGLAVTVALQVGDEAKGLLAHARDGLGVPHSPDLFHVQHELSRGTAAVLAAQTRQAQGYLDRTRERLGQARAARGQAVAQPRGLGRPIDHDGRVEGAERAVAGGEGWVATCEGRQEQARAAVRGLGEADHPFDLASGHAQDGGAVEARLSEQMGRLEALAAEVKLPEGGRRRLAKARRVLPGLVAAVAFYWVRVRAASDRRYGAESWEPVERLVAGMYLRRAAGKAGTAQRRRQLRALAEVCLAEGRAGPEPAGGWAEAEGLAREWSGWFQRSSSCVEGRNGQLALRHHGLHRLGKRKLEALTAVHNYWLRRGGTTAAERFFGGKPDDLFAWLLERLPLPARPARQRSRAA